MKLHNSAEQSTDQCKKKIAQLIFVFFRFYDTLKKNKIKMIPTALPAVHVKLFIYHLLFIVVVVVAAVVVV